MLLPLIATLSVSGIGMMIGIVTGYLAGRVDRVVVAVLDVLLALPWLLVLLACVSGWGSGPVVLGMALTPWGVVAPAVLIGALAVSANLLVDRLARRLAR